MIFQNIFKGVGNHDYEMGRILWFLGGFFMIGYQGYAIFQGQAFNPIEFGTGFGALLAAGGLGIAAKDTGAAKVKSASTPDINVGTVTGGMQAENAYVGTTP